MSLADCTHRDLLKVDLDSLAQFEEIFWRQKSRALWLREGDNNTGFFHKIANSNCRRNYMRCIEVNGIQNEDESELKEKVVEFYSTLYQESEDWRPKVVDLPFKTIGEEALRVLERPSVQEEILQVLKDLQCDQALGPDGYTMAFFEFFNIVREWSRMILWVSLGRL